ncbi:MAG: DNRLRE domain-containing protein [Candidatus Bathyarchaeia archaeon]
MKLGIRSEAVVLIILLLLWMRTREVDVQAVESTLTIQPSEQDTFVNSMYLHTKYPEDPHGYLWGIFVGNMYVEYDSYKLHGSSRIYIKFNITSIPKDAKILFAEMCLYMYDPPKTAQEYEVYRVLSDWDQHKLTWKTQPSFVRTPTSTATIGPAPRERWVCWTITDDLKLWHSDPARNYGMMIRIKHEMNASDQVASFYPRESRQPQELKPKLVVRVDWHQPLESSPPPVPTPEETSHPEPSPAPATTPPATIPAEPTTKEEAPTPETPTHTFMLGIVSVLVIVGFLAFVIRRHAIPSKPSALRRPKRRGRS